jgi:hypothetical protein
MTNARLRSRMRELGYCSTAALKAARAISGLAKAAAPVLAIQRVRGKNISMLSERLKEIRNRQFQAQAKTIYHVRDPDPAP